MGSLIETARTKRGLSRADLARILKVSMPTVWRWEAGKRKVDEKYVPKLAKELDLDPAAVRPDLAKLFEAA